MKKRDRKSIRFQFLRFIAVIFILIFTVVLLSNLHSYNSWAKYKKTFKLYDELSRFYDQVEVMNVRMKNFIYTENSEEFGAYLDHAGRARKAVENLKALGNPELQFRFGLLENMLDTYNEKAAALLAAHPEYNAQEEYDAFDRLKLLIHETYPGYAKLITSEMNREKERMFALWKAQLLVTVILFSVLLIVSILFSISSIRGITRPLQKMITNINRIKVGKFDIRSVESGSREINILLTAFEEMAENLRDYVDMIRETSRMEKQLIEQENDNLRIKRVLAETRLNALQGQMNPHFLFNTLSMISKLAYIEGADRTSELMVSTASLLRYSLDMSAKTSSLDREIACVKNYFDIQRRRAGERIAFTIRHTEAFREVMIPGMILQPLIENCVVHGVKDMTRGAFVDVEIWRNGGRVVITIEDNGAGIPGDRLEILNRRSEEPVPSESIGLSNVKERLDICYGGDYRFLIDSSEGCGTVLMLEIPAEVPA